MSRTALLAFLPFLVSALRLKDEEEELAEEFEGMSLGNSLGSARRGGPAGGNVSGATWPDTWMVAHEHGHFIAHLLDEKTLFDFVHAKSEGYSAVTMALPDYNIPAMKMHHAVPGFQATSVEQRKKVTTFPSYLALASSWDPDLVYDVAYAVSEEFKTLGANVMLGPAINIHRATQHDEEFDSLSGEDPTLGSVLTRSWILATQTHGIMSVPKFLGQAEQTPVHFENSSANLTSWDIFYPPFETAIDVGAAGVMCASHEVNGLWSCRDGEMLERDLKQIMGFHGMVMSDIGTAREYFPYASSFEKGLDLMVQEPEIIPRSDHMIKGMRKAATRVLASVWHMRFEADGGCTPPNCGEYLSRTATSDAHKQVAIRAAGSAIVLLKNDGLLPLTSDTVKTVALVGPAAGGKGSGVGWHDFVTPFAAIKEAGEAVGITVTDEMEGADACVVMGTNQAVFSRWQLDAATFDAINQALRVCSKTAVFMELTGAVVTPWRDQVQAVASMFHSGEETALGWAATLFGQNSPSGKLPIGFPDFTQEVPEWWTEAAPSYWDDAQFAFPFGHGLSYAKLNFTEVKQKPTKVCHAPLCVQVAIDNIGTKYSGAEVVQAYLRFPGAGHPTVLRAFKKTKVLAPGQRDIVLFRFTYRDLSLYKDVGNHTEPEQSWSLQEKVDVLIGSSSRDIKHTMSVKPSYG